MATPKGSIPTGTFATTVLLAVAITETVLELYSRFRAQLPVSAKLLPGSAGHA
ncbi:MAG: hypothetical protein WAL56_20670 [Candidatus Sulfotelmatobacter sp.]